MPLLTNPDALEALSQPASGIYQQLAADWANIPAGYQSFILMVRELFKLADLETNNGQLYGGACVFCGGHVELDDGGVFYTHWRAAQDNGRFAGGQRISSHTSDQQQYEIALPLTWGTILFGTRNGGTWFQNEAYPITTTKTAWWGHVGTTIQYGASKVGSAVSGGAIAVKNIGAKGKSANDDANPLRLTDTFCDAVAQTYIKLWTW